MKRYHPIYQSILHTLLLAMFCTTALCSNIAQARTSIADLQAEIEQLNAGPDPACYDNSGNQYVNCNNGTVVDNVTGLIWLADPDCPLLGQPKTWADAKLAVASLGAPQCGLTDNSKPGDWRLPTGPEWTATVDALFVISHGNIANILQLVFPNATNTISGPAGMGATGGCWLAGSLGPRDPRYAETMNDSGVDDQLKTNALCFWPVRSGK